MKTLKSLFSIILITFALVSVTSCGDESEDPTPVKPVETLELSDLDGNWITVKTTYAGVDYQASTVCSDLTSVTKWKKANFGIVSSTNKITFTDVCESFVGTYDVVFNETTKVITVTGSFNQKYEIVSYDLNSTPKKATIKLIDNGGISSLTVGLTYHVEK